MTEPIPPNHPIVGTWHLTRFTEEDLTTGAVSYPFGPRPRAFVIYSGDGHVATIFTATDRRQPVADRATDQEAIALYRSMIAFAGRYGTAGGALIYHPEISWNESWNGTRQERLFAIDGDRLEVRSVPAVSVLTGTQTVFSLVWRRAR